MNKASPWTVKETCAYLKIGRTTLYRYVNRGWLKPKKIGHSIRFNPEKVMAFAYAGLED